jgi:hypothetical protein
VTEETWIAYRGPQFVLEWARDARGEMPGREFFVGLDDSVAAKVLALFAALGTQGRISNRQKFKCLGESGENLWEFKPTSQVRILGDFRPGRRFLLACGVVKKQSDLRSEDIQKAKRILGEHDARERKAHDGK